MKLTKATRSGSTWIEREDGHPVALMMAGSMPNCEAKADEIIGACNSHGQLVADREGFRNRVVELEGLNFYLVAALREIKKNDPFMQSSAGVVARKALIAAGVNP